jgi:hemerythrin-like metal-binding protein
MPAINWNVKYSVGIHGIDDQHKRLFELINQLSESMKSGKNTAAVGNVFLELVNYTDQHFKMEEKLFKQYGYPDSQNHIKVHNELREKAFELKAKHEAGSLVVTIQLLNFLVEWVNKHILEEDKKYSAFLTSKGVV